jgi:hypothetical protein
MQSAEGFKTSSLVNLNNKETITNFNTLSEINKEGDSIISIKNLSKLFSSIENNYFGVLKVNHD